MVLAGFAGSPIPSTHIHPNVRNARPSESRIALIVAFGACIVCRAFAGDLFAYLDSLGKDDITAVSARKSVGYVRVQLADGSYLPESYVFGPGGVWRGDMVDDTIDKLKFSDVAHMIAGPLASQNYVPSRNPNTTKLLIMVYWGTSNGQEHASESAAYENLNVTEASIRTAQMSLGPPPTRRSATSVDPRTSPNVQSLQDQETTEMAAVAAENRRRDEADVLNVNMLGYESWWEGTQKYEGTPMRFLRQDLLDEIEEDRYFVVLMAYDFQLMQKMKKHRLLWETRFSVRERHHAFNEDLPLMAKYASQFFGQDSRGLVHRELPFGRVDVGPVKSLGEADEPKN